jgi:hypothetical protein
MEYSNILDDAVFSPEEMAISGIRMKGDMLVVER